MSTAMHTPGHKLITKTIKRYRAQTLSGSNVSRQLRFEDSTGMCDTCPGELDSPEAVYQAEPAASPKWPVTALLGRCAINLLGASVALMAILLLASAVNSGLTKLVAA